MLYYVIVTVTGLTIIAEAIALFIGLVALHKNTLWLTWQNRFYLYSDILLGFVLIFCRRQESMVLFYTALILLIITHSYREYEYVSAKTRKFCFNLPLFIVNNIKLMGLFSIMILIAVEWLSAVV